MRKISLFLTIAALLTLGSCKHERTTYQVNYRFDNTEMESEALVVYECDSIGRANGKWRSSHHKFDTIMTAEGQRIMASGSLDEVARPGCSQLWVYCEHMDGTHTFMLDTVFNLRLLEDNVIDITPEMEWVDKPIAR